MKARIFVGLIVAAVVLAGAFLAGQYLGSLCPASHHGQTSVPAGPARDVAMPAILAPDAPAPDHHPEAFMAQDRAGHISSNRVWKFEDDWFADGGKLGCRRFSTEGATLEFCLDPANTGTGCPGREPPHARHTLR
jgi:hypothetical protein